jgi:outer membrane protein assembly factor BamB
MTPSGLVVIVGTDNGHIDKFNETGTRIWTYDTNPQIKNYAAVPSVAVSDEGEYIVAGTLGGQILLMNSEGELLWSSNQTHDHIHHVAMSANGAFILATGEETVYAFTTRYQDFNQAPASGTNTQQSTLETPETVFEDPASSSADSPAAPPVITSPPNEYSVIVTQQSPLSQGACLAALLILVIWRKGH